MSDTEEISEKLENPKPIKKVLFYSVIAATFIFSLFVLSLILIPKSDKQISECRKDLNKKVCDSFYIKLSDRQVEKRKKIAAEKAAKEKKKAAKKAAEKRRRENGQHCIKYYGLTMYVPSVVRYTKKRLRNPMSFQHIKTTMYKVHANRLTKSLMSV